MVIDLTLIFPETVKKRPVIPVNRFWETILGLCMVSFREVGLSLLMKTVYKRNSYYINEFTKSFTDVNVILLEMFQLGYCAGRGGRVLGATYVRRKKTG